MGKMMLLITIMTLEYCNNIVPYSAGPGIEPDGYGDHHMDVSCSITSVMILSNR